MEISANKQAIYAAVAAAVVVGIGLSPLGTRLAQSILAKLPSSLSPSLNSPLVGRATTLFTAGIISYAVYAYLAPNAQPDPSTKKDENKNSSEEEKAVNAPAKNEEREVGPKPTEHKNTTQVKRKFRATNSNGPKKTTPPKSTTYSIRKNGVHSPVKSPYPKKLTS